jgi:hypothetical protein
LLLSLRREYGDGKGLRKTAAWSRRNLTDSAFHSYPRPGKRRIF